MKLKPFEFQQNSNGLQFLFVKSNQFLVVYFGMVGSRNPDDELTTGTHLHEFPHVSLRVEELGVSMYVFSALGIKSCTSCY